MLDTKYVCVCRRRISLSMRIDFFFIMFENEKFSLIQIVISFIMMILYEEMFVHLKLMFHHHDHHYHYYYYFKSIHSILNCDNKKNNTCTRQNRPSKKKRKETTVE